MAKKKKTIEPSITPTGEAMLDDFRQRMVKEEAERVKALADFLKAFSPDNSIGVSTLLADYLHTAKSCGHLALQWTVEKYWALRMPAMMQELNRIYDELLSKKITRNKKVDFNDADDRVWYEPSKPFKVVCHTTQSYNFLYIWKKDDEQLAPGSAFGAVSGRGMRRLHVRRFYDHYREVASDKYEKEQDDKFKKAVMKDGRLAAIREMWLLENYADDGVQYPKKLSLDAYRKLGFEPIYGDARDPGYILTWDEFAQKVDDAIHHHSMLYHLEECFIPGMTYALFEKEE
jgi:hypothetical protein